MGQVLLFGVLLTLFPLITIKKFKEESRTQKFFHLGSLVVGITLLILFSIQFSTYLD
ncbi:hypothetical protein [Halobacillus hunanensis]|uniref:hypothetical protein n=1 Tax=Halobacillus hunanensis TaxID=578214 RepID=UPI00158FA59F|nr:hypothetical protein [Halobacillus hunanensis]